MGAVMPEADAASASAAARRAGVRIGTAHEPEQLRSIAELFRSVWGSGPEQDPIGADVLRAIAHSGGAVHVASDGHGPVGAAAAVFGPPGARSAYSLIAASRALGNGVGFALKHAQRSWALERGATSLSWTFDPLVSRNARFNLVKLGAVADEYVTDFYGPLADGTNDGDETDRLTVTWALDGARTVDAARGRLPLADHPDLADAEGRAPDGGPLTLEEPRGLWCRVPTDVITVRRTDPALAAAWRAAVRDVLVPALADGLVVVGMSRDGWYHLSREEQQ